MLKKINRSAYDKVYTLLADSFPREERRSREGQERLLDNPRYQIYVPGKDADGTVSGFAAVWDFETFRYLEHFAVDPALRGGGIGSDMLKDLTERGKRRICLEVEPPDTAMAKRRIAFYERNGFFLNPYAYMQPSLGEGRPAIPLLIMTSGSMAKEAAFCEMRDLLYRHVYQVKP